MVAAVIFALSVLFLYFFVLYLILRAVPETPLTLLHVAEGELDYGKMLA